MTLKVQLIGNVAFYVHGRQLTAIPKGQKSGSYGQEMIYMHLYLLAKMQERILVEDVEALGRMQTVVKIFKNKENPTDAFQIMHNGKVLTAGKKCIKK